jgi:hypothetical protein
MRMLALPVLLLAFFLVALPIPAAFPQGLPAAQSQASVTAENPLVGSWSGKWTSSKGHYGRIEVTIDNNLVGTFKEFGGTGLITYWRATAKKEGQKYIFDSNERIDTLWVENGKLEGTYDWKRKPSKGSLEFTRAK